MPPEPCEEWPDDLKEAYQNWFDAMCAEDALENDWVECSTHGIALSAACETERTQAEFNRLYAKWENENAYTPA